MRAGQNHKIPLKDPSPDARLITARDIPVVGYIGPLRRDEPLLLDFEIRYLGQPVALLAVRRGNRLETADPAELVEVACTEAAALHRPRMFDVPDLEMRNRTIAAEAIGVPDAARSAIDDAPVVARGRFHFPPVRHDYLGPDQCTATVAGGTARDYDRLPRAF